MIDLDYVALEMKLITAQQTRLLNIKQRYHLFRFSYGDGFHKLPKLNQNC